MEHELCANCKKEIPQHNYVMHTAHCARNITLCRTCQEPVPKAQFEDHKKQCHQPKPLPPPPEPKTTLENSPYFQERKLVEDKKKEQRQEQYMKRHEHLVSRGQQLGALPKQRDTPLKTVDAPFESVDTPFKSDAPTNNAIGSSKPTGTRINPMASAPKPANTPTSTMAPPTKAKASGLLACKYCDLELPKLDLEEHENYCGTRTDKCPKCLEHVMFKELDNHICGRGAASRGAAPISDYEDFAYIPRRRLPPLRLTEMDFDPLPYMPPSLTRPGAPPGIKIKEGESYKEISRRLDCKTEYIRNLLHDSASITVPIRHSGLAPRNHYYHDKGPAPQPPRRRNPPTELQVDCEFCGVPMPHEDLIDHEAICRLTRKSHVTVPCTHCHVPILQEDIRLHEECCAQQRQHRPHQPIEALPQENRWRIPCEFCDRPISPDDLILHQTGCRPDLAQLQGPRRRPKSPDSDDYYYDPAPAHSRHQQQAQYQAPEPTSPEIELPCEFCADMIPASQLLRHQATCS